MTKEPAQTEAQKQARAVALQELLSLLARSESAAAVLEQMASPTERELARRAALVRYFDQRLFTTVLAAALPLEDLPAAFQEFIARSDVEAIPRNEALYRLKDTARKNYRNAWPGEDDAQRAFYQRLVTFYEAETPVPQLDLLNALLGCDPVRAEQLFRQLYEAAEAEFNLPACDTLLNILNDHQLHLNADLQQLHLQSQRRYDTRSRFATEYYKSAVYLTRTELHDAFKAFLAQDQTWIFQLYATGGLGKTTFLRWLMARYCVPRELPVARLDFDFLGLSQITEQYRADWLNSLRGQTVETEKPPERLSLDDLEKYPWLLLQPLAVQLRDQLGGFERLVVDATGLREFAVLLKKPATKLQAEEYAKAVAKLGASDSYWQKLALDEFAYPLTQRTLTQPVLIILDTLEEMVLTQPETLRRIVDYFAELHGKCPQLRLLLAGRYNLEERVPGFSAQERHDMTTVKLSRFSVSESMTYLRDIRRLGEHLPLTVLAEEADGNPFKLSLFADIASSRASMTEEEVRNLPRTALAYLLDRVIERIPEPDVRWVLRYGVVPRQSLTRSFLENVLRPHLETERARVQQDDPQKLPQDLARNQSYQNKKLWLHQQAPLDLGQVWEDLLRYASSYGWVSFAEETGFQFEPDVLIPMRELLQEQSIFSVLHQSAADYFKQQARRHPKQWAAFACEAVYHQFQSVGAAAGAFWRKMLDRATNHQQIPALLALAEEVTGPEYVEDGQPRHRQFDQRLMIELDDLCYAHRVAAEAALQLPHEKARRTEIWRLVRSHLQRLQALQSKRFSGLLPLLLQAAEAMQSEQKAAAVPLLAQCVKRAKPTALRLSLAWQLAELQADLQLPEAEANYQTALHLAEAEPKLWPAPPTIRRALATWHDQQHHFVEAEQFYQSLWERPAARRNQLVVGFGLIRLYLRFGRFAQARKVARQVEMVVQEPADQFTLHLLSAEFELACRRPLAALEYLDKADALPSAATSAALTTKLGLRGTSLGQLLEFGSAMETLEVAQHQWSILGDQEGQSRCRLRMAEIQLHGVGNLKEAGGYLESWQRAAQESTVPLETETRLRLELLYVEVLMRIGDPKAQEHWQKVIAFPWVRRVPQWHALALTLGLALGYADHAQAEEWQQAQAQIKPATARLATLEPLRLWRPAQKVGDKVKASVSENEKALREMLRASLRAWLQAESKTALASPDNVAQLICIADGYRWLDERAPKFWATLARQSWRAFAARELRQAADRWQEQFDEDPLPELIVSDERDMQRYPMWEMARAVEEAERLFAQGRYEECQALVNRYKDRFNTSFPAHWYARCRVLLGKLQMIHFQHDGNEAALQMAENEFRNAQHLYRVLNDQLSDERISQTRDQMLSLASLPNAASSKEMGPKEMGPKEMVSKEMPAQKMAWSESAIKRSDIEPPAYTVWFQTQQEMRIGSDLLLARGNQAALVLNTTPAQIFPERETLLPHLAQLSRHDLTNWLDQESPRALGQVLFTRKEAAELRKGYFRTDDVQINLPPGPLCALPWEMGSLFDDETSSVGQHVHSFSRTTPQNTPLRATVLWAQRAIALLTGQKLVVDGIYGPRSRAALADLQKKFSLAETDGSLNRATITAMVNALSAQSRPPLRVLIVESNQRGLFRYYSGTETRILSEPRWATLKEELSFAPHILHLDTTMEESSRDGEIAIRLGPDEFITASRLTQFCKELPTRPLVILDLPRPFERRECWRHLLLRNQFAAELFHWEQTNGVLAMGLLSPSERDRFLATLVQNLMAGKSLGDVVSAQELAPVLTPEPQPIGWPVLWTLDPGLSLLPEGSAS